MMDNSVLIGMLEVVLRKLDDLTNEKKAALTICAFAKKSGYSRWTIQRKIKEGEIATNRDGRIPYSELRRYVS